MDAADGVPGESLAVLGPSGSGALAPVGSVEIPPMPNEVTGLLPAGSLDRQDAPPAEVAPAPGPELANGRG